MESEQDTGEVEAVPSGEEPSWWRDPVALQQQTLLELQRIRYRLGVLVFWFVALPVIAGLITWIVISISEG